MKNIVSTIKKLQAEIKTLKGLLKKVKPIVDECHSTPESWKLQITQALNGETK